MTESGPPPKRVAARAALNREQRSQTMLAAEGSACFA